MVDSMIRVNAYEYMLHDRTRRQAKKPEKKCAHGFDAALEEETQKLERRIDMETKKSATAALVVAIIGLILSLLFALGGLVLSIIGIVLAAKAKAQQWSKANAALVISIIGLVLAVLNMVVGAILAAA